MVDPQHARYEAQRPDHAAIWRRALERLRDAVDRQTFQTYFADTHAIEVRGGVLHIGVPQPINAQTLRANYYTHIGHAVRSEAGRPMEIELRVAPRPETTPSGRSATSADGPHPQLHPSQRGEREETPAEQRARRTRPSLNPNHTFERFIVGNANAIAAAAAESAANFQDRDFNPLFIYAASGQGKTHLLEAVAHRTQDQHSTAYIDAERYVREFVASVVDGGRAKFQERYESSDVLIVDDIQKLGDKTGTQDEFFNLFNAVHRRGGQIVLASDVHPRLLASMAERLVTRFQSGFVCKIEDPDAVLCLAILTRASRDDGVQLDDDTARAIVERADGNVRSLLGAWRTVRLHAKLDGVPVDEHLARRVLAEHPPKTDARQRPTAQQVMVVVAAVTGVSPEMLRGRRRDARTSRARHVLMHELDQHTDMKLQEIGQLLDGRDHSTVINGRDAVRKGLEAGGRAPEGAWFTRTIAEVRSRLQVP